MPSAPSLLREDSAWAKTRSGGARLLSGSPRPTASCRRLAVGGQVSTLRRHQLAAWGAGSAASQGGTHPGPPPPAGSRGRTGSRRAPTRVCPGTCTGSGAQQDTGASTHPCSQRRRVRTRTAHTRRPCLYTQPRPERGRRAETRLSPRGHTGAPAPSAPGSWARLCHSRVSFTALSGGRGFHNTSGLFTERCENTLSRLQPSLPEGSGACPSLHWAGRARRQQQPQLLKGPAGLALRAGRWGPGQRPAGQPLAAPCPVAAGPPTRGVPAEMKRAKAGDWKAPMGLGGARPSWQTTGRGAGRMGPSVSRLSRNPNWGEPRRPSRHPAPTRLLPGARSE